MEDKTEWYVVPHAGLVGVIKYWIVDKNKVKQEPGIVVKREIVRVLTSKSVMNIISVIEGMDKKTYMLSMRKVTEVEKP